MVSVAPRVSIIVPVLNESDSILQRLQSLKMQLVDIPVELIVVDGGSEDDTAGLASTYADRVIYADKGRARQMNAGANAALGDYLLFLHIDTTLPSDFFVHLKKVLSQHHRWGFYHVQLSGRSFAFRVIETMMMLRSRMTRVATGDQGIFISRELFLSLNGYADLPLMEDVEMCKRLRKISPPFIIKATVTTSSRRWEENGISRTVWLMWCLRAKYFAGVPPSVLVKQYYR